MQLNKKTIGQLFSPPFNKESVIWVYKDSNGDTLCLNRNSDPPELHPKSSSHRLVGQLHPDGSITATAAEIVQVRQPNDTVELIAKIIVWFIKTVGRICLILAGIGALLLLIIVGSGNRFEGGKNSQYRR